MIETEKAFAADTAKRGGGYSFRSFVAPNAVGLLPNPQTGVVDLIDAKQRIDSRAPPPKPRPSELRWWPAVASMAGAADLGFTSGPVIFPGKQGYGFVFTVWERQPDGSWRFFFDGGPKTDGPSTMTEGQPVRILPTATGRASSPEQAVREVDQAERAISANALADAVVAYRPYLTRDSVLMGSGGQPAFGRATGARELARRGASVRFEQLGTRSARSADFVFTFGRAVVNGTVNGGYARVWLKTKQGWRIAFDQVQVPEKPPA